MGCARPWVPMLGALGLVALLAGCGMSRQAGAAVDAGHQATKQGELLSALEHYRIATRLAPDSATAQLALGEAAEALGEFDEALSAYQAAARRAPSTRTWRRLGEMADRMGQVDVAFQSLEHAYGSWREHASVGLEVGTVMFVTCVPKVWPRVSAVWSVCLPSASRIGRASFRSSRETVAQYAFRVLVEAERADCAAVLGERVADEGLARLGRMMLRDRAARSREPEVREQAEWALRYRLPEREVSKLAESLNVTGWQLQHRRNKPAEALAAYTKAIAADPLFSWPYNNIGRLYLSQNDDAQALHWFAKALEVNPNHLRAESNRGLAAARLGRYDEALASFERVLAVNPTDAHAHASLGWLLLNAGRRTDGLRELQVALRLEPGLEEARSVLDAQYGRDARRGPTPFSAR